MYIFRSFLKHLIIELSFSTWREILIIWVVSLTLVFFILSNYSLSDMKIAHLTHIGLQLSIQASLGCPRYRSNFQAAFYAKFLILCFMLHASLMLLLKIHTGIVWQISCIYSNATVHTTHINTTPFCICQTSPHDFINMVSTLLLRMYAPDSCLSLWYHCYRKISIGRLSINRYIVHWNDVLGNRAFRSSLG